MPNRNKKRGYQLEAECRDFWIANGFTAKRTLAGGQYKNFLGKEHAADLWIEEFSVEAKRKKTGFKFLYNSLAQDEASMLCIKQDYCDRLYVLREATLLQLLNMAYRK